MAKTPRRSNRLPAHRRHATNQGVVTLGGWDFYTGVFGTAKSDQRYRELVSEWIANDRKILPLKKSRRDDGDDLGISVAEMCVRFMNWARAQYRDESGDKEELRTLERSVKLLEPDRFALIPAKTFDGQHFSAIRDDLIRAKKSRATINSRMNRIKRIFNWAADEKLIPKDVAATLKEIKHLRAGERGVRERPDVEPVDQKTFESTLPYFRPQLRDFVQLLRLTGARCGELCLIRSDDVYGTADPEVVVYRPSHHKNKWRGMKREIFIGPKGRAILDRWSTEVKPGSFIFHKARSKDPLATKDVDSAIRKAIRAANRKEPKKRLQHWHPHQTRHAFASEVAARFGIGVTRVLLGHAKGKDITQHYVKIDLTEVLKAVKEIG